MTTRTKIELRRSEIRSRLGEIAALTGDDLTEAIQGERDTLMTELADTEPQLRAAIEAEGEEVETRAGAGEYETPEVRERLELRSRASLGAYLVAHLRGKQVTGAEAELQEAAGVDGIPLELFETREVLEKRNAPEGRAVTGAPSTVGINLDVIRPAVFAPSIAPRLMVEMPMVESGTYASGTITTSATAGAKAKSAAIDATAGVITVNTTTPHRIGARLETTLEDIAAVGQQNFESVLRDNVSLVLSDELDKQVINGDGSGNNLTGLIARLTDPTDPSAVAGFDDFVAAFAGGIDGLWASMLSEVAIVAGVDTFKLSAKTFRDQVTGGDGSETGVSLGNITAADYLRENTAGWWTNKRMPATASNIQAGILCRKGRPGMRTAVCPHWGYIGIDDIYSGSAKGERYFTISVLVGDVILVQPDAYSRVDFKVS